MPKVSLPTQRGPLPSTLASGFGVNVTRKMVIDRKTLLKNLNLELPYDSGIPLLGTYPKELKPGCQRGICISKFTAALFTMAKRRKRPTCPLMDEWISRMWPTHAMEYYSIERNEMLAHSTIRKNLEELC